MELLRTVRRYVELELLPRRDDLIWLQASPQSGQSGLRATPKVPMRCRDESFAEQQDGETILLHFELVGEDRREIEAYENRLRRWQQHETPVVISDEHGNLAPFTLIVRGVSPVVEEPSGVPRQICYVLRASLEVQPRAG